MTTTAIAAPSITDALTFVANAQSEDELDRLRDAITARRQSVAAIRAAAITIGTRVQLSGLSPKYVNGLTGTVEAYSRGKRTRMDVRLDEVSTRRLRFMGASRFPVAEGVQEHLFGGVPMVCLMPL